MVVILGVSDAALKQAQARLRELNFMTNTIVGKKLGAPTTAYFVFEGNLLPEHLQLLFDLSKQLVPKAEYIET